ncbi:MAG: tRNA (adenine-N(1)-)-methyltransferase catalytic subunit trm61 [Bathelium mastoideum]|nr:MAG: tRNA (adenine-N(1)-)-methyltransferase catalytic subunit trm61 [Bathelium mastoideum]
MASDAEPTPVASPFLTPLPRSAPHSLAILYLSRDLQVPVQLKETVPNSVAVTSAESNNIGYARDAVVNTRFGTYPHRTLTHVPWGSQVLASKVDTGSWGRNKKKRKRDESQDKNPPIITPSDELEDLDANAWSGSVQQQSMSTADSGFAHLVLPTPEVWTRALRHRTQVVYTPDYSYILQRLRVRPGTCIIEAGAGSGSFTHAAARAVYNGYPFGAYHRAVSEELANDRGRSVVQANTLAPMKRKRRGKVYSFEFHEPRAELLEQDIRNHGLQDIVQITHRDVYGEGFRFSEGSVESAPSADAVFLDLPAPWLALKHLTRNGSIEEPEASREPEQPEQSTSHTDLPDNQEFTKPAKRYQAPCSPLNPLTTTRICTFSPCIEQAQRTITTLRSLGWVDVEMVEIMHKRLEIRRERIGLQEEGLRGVNASPASVDEALGRLKEIECRQRAFHEQQQASSSSTQANAAKHEPSTLGGKSDGEQKPKAGSLGTMSKAERLKSIREAEGKRKLFKEGRLVHRTEPELKTHTSYLVFAMLPRKWTIEDEEACQQKWRVNESNENAAAV